MYKKRFLVVSIVLCFISIYFIILIILPSSFNYNLNLDNFIPTITFQNNRNNYIKKNIIDISTNNLKLINTTNSTINFSITYEENSNKIFNHTTKNVVYENDSLTFSNFDEKFNMSFTNQHLSIYTSSKAFNNAKDYYSVEPNETILINFNTKEIDEI